MYAWIAWGIAGLFYMYEFAHRVAPSVMVPELMQHFGSGHLAIGNLSAAYYYAYAIMQIPAGILIDRYGVKWPLTVAAMAIAIGSYIFANTNVIAFAELGRMLIGIGSAFSFLGCLQLAATLFPKQHFALLVGCTNLLGVVGAIWGGKPLRILVENYSWTDAMLISTLVGIIFTILLPICIKQQRPYPHNHAPSKYLHPGKQKTIVIAALYGACMVVPIAVFAELWGVVFLTNKYQLTQGFAAQLISYIFIGIAIGGPIFGFCGRNSNNRSKVLFIGAIGAFNVTIILLFYPSLSILALSILLFLCGLFSSSMLLCFSITKELATAKIRATAIGFTNMIIMGGSAIFQPAIGFLIDKGTFINNAHNLQIALIILPVAQFIAILLIRYLNTSVATQ